MDDDRVLVPPEVYDELDSLHQAGELNPDGREEAARVASERGYDSAMKRLEQVGDAVYAQAARGRSEAGTNA